MEDLGRSAEKTEHQGEKGTETDEVGRAGEVRVDGFGVLSGQNGPPDEEQGAQPSRPRWRGPFWRIWAAERPKRNTRGRARSSAKQTNMARSVLRDLGKTDDQGRARSTAKQTKLARSVLEDLGR